MEQSSRPTAMLPIPELTGSTASHDGALPKHMNLRGITGAAMGAG